MPADWGGRGARARASSISYPFFELAGHEVWGATAMILGEFAALFAPEFGPPPIS